MQNRFFDSPREAGRITLRLVLASCYLASALGGAFHYALEHAIPETASTCATGLSHCLESGCGDEDHPDSTTHCLVCQGLSRIAATCPATAVSPGMVLSDVSFHSPAPPALYPPYRPQTQRGPPVLV